MTRRLIIRAHLVRQVRDLVCDRGEGESCGFLMGRTVDHVAYVDRVRSVSNLYESAASDRFAIGDADYRSACASGDPSDAIVAIFHTHQGAAEASYCDRRNMRIHSWPWLIVGVSRAAYGWEMHWRCFHWTVGRVRVVPVDVPPDPHLSASNDRPLVACSARNDWPTCRRSSA